MTIATGSIFENNRTQAVRLPAETRFPPEVRKVAVRVLGVERILAPVDRTWDSFFAAAEGVSISADRFETLAAYMDHIPPTTRSSLLTDLDGGRRIEVEALHGAAVRRAAAHGIAVPMLATLYAVLRPWAAGAPSR